MRTLGGLVGLILGAAAPAVLYCVYANYGGAGLLWLLVSIASAIVGYIWVESVLDCADFGGSWPW